MRVLFLDDDKNRFLEFSNILGIMLKRGEIKNLEVKWAINATMAKDFLVNCLRFDLALLDHDLAAEHYQTVGQPPPLMQEEDGREVARFIAEMPPEEQPRMCHIHSWNYSGSKEMEMILMDAGIHTTRAMFPKGVEDVVGAMGALCEKPL